VSGGASSATALAARLDDRLNPILVKEVRQALRGLYFKVTFLFALFAAASVGTIVLLLAASHETSRFGPEFFIAIFVCLAAAVHCFVPFLAFVSMSGEWDENTYDLLVLSDLKPRQIVLGKLLSAGTVALLHYSAFGPFLVMAFLLRGIDLLSILVIIGGSMVYSLALSAIAIALSTLARHRFLRVALMALLAALLVFATAMSIAAAVGIVFEPEMLREPEAPLVLLGAALLTLFVAGFAVAVACARLAHAEENRSSGLRAITIGAVVAAIAWSAALAIEVGEPLVVLGPLTVMPFVLLFFFAFFSTEPERLGRRVSLHVPKGRFAAALSAPFLPGGGRGVLLFLVVALAAAVSGAIGVALQSRSTSAGTDSVVGGVLIAWLYAILYIAVPSLVSSRWTETPKGRLRARLFFLFCFIGPLLIPSLFGFFLGIEDLLDMAHPGNPFWAVFRVWRYPDAGDSLLLVFVLIAAVLALALSVPRLATALHEVRAASDRRRDRERERVSLVTAPSDAAPVA
jgi:ABC-type transport system involved in multi-copper enzyme maturation permease subunit